MLFAIEEVLKGRLEMASRFRIIARPKTRHLMSGVLKPMASPISAIAATSLHPLLFLIFEIVANAFLKSVARVLSPRVGGTD